MSRAESRIKTGFRLVFARGEFTLSRMKTLLLSLLLASPCLAVTKEVVRVFCPASYHDTDSASEYGVQGDLVQAAVMDRPMVLSGAFPEDLVKAVFAPLRLPSNNPTYEVEEANLLVLCELAVQAEREGESLEVVIDCAQLQIPEVVELSAQQVLSMAVESLRRTLRLYYLDDAHESFRCQITLQGLAKERQDLASLKTTFEIGSQNHDG